MTVIDGYFGPIAPDNDLVIITARGTVGRRQGIFAHINSKKILFSVITHAYDNELLLHREGGQ